VLADSRRPRGGETTPRHQASGEVLQPRPGDHGSPGRHHERRLPERPAM